MELEGIKGVFGWGMKRFHFYFQIFGFQQKRSRAAIRVSIWKFTINSWNAPTPPKRLDETALLDTSALLPSLIWLSNQTNNRAALFYSTLQPNKKWSDSVLLAKRKIERICSACQTQNRTTPFYKTEIEPLHSSWLPNQMHPKIMFGSKGIGEYWRAKIPLLFKIE
jgi:hypothetical protein